MHQRARCNLLEELRLRASKFNIHHSSFTPRFSRTNDRAITVSISIPAFFVQFWA